MVTYNKDPDYDNGTYDKDTESEEYSYTTQAPTTQAAPVQALAPTQPQTQQMPPQAQPAQPKEKVAGKGVIRGWIKKEAGAAWQKLRAPQDMTPEERHRVRDEKIAQAKGYLSSFGNALSGIGSNASAQQPQQSPIQTQGAPQQQGATMEMVMQNLFGQTPPPMAYAQPSAPRKPKQSRARQRLPPARQATPSAYAEPTMSSAMLVNNMFGETQQQAMKGRGTARPMADSRGYGMYGPGITDMVNRSFGFAPPPMARARRGATRHSKRRR